MPELPEVETIRRVLEPQIKGLTVTAVTVNRLEVIGHPTVDEFFQILTGQTMETMTRRGKFLSVLLNSGDYFVLHLRMTGCLLLTPADYPAEKHTHIVFHLSSGHELRFLIPAILGGSGCSARGRAIHTAAWTSWGWNPLTLA